MESELVSGFMTEHAAVIFVFFFLAEYASIVLICILISILFIGGYLLDPSPLIYLIQYIDYEFFTSRENILSDSSFINLLTEGIFYGIILALKTCIMIFVFI